MGEPDSTGTHGGSYPLHRIRCKADLLRKGPCEGEDKAAKGNTREGTRLHRRTGRTRADAKDGENPSRSIQRAPAMMPSGTAPRDRISIAIPRRTHPKRLSLKEGEGLHGDMMPEAES